MAHAHNSGAHGHHIIPYKVYFVVFGGLLFLTITTVLTAKLDLGGFNVPLALAIATVKAALVVAFFMALKYDKKINRMVFGVGILFVFVFLGFVMLDTEFRGAFDPMKGMTVDQHDAYMAEQEARAAAIE